MLVSLWRFELVCPPSLSTNPVLSRAMSQIPHGYFDSRSRRWSFRLQEHGTVLERLRGIGASPSLGVPNSELASGLLYETVPDSVVRGLLELVPETRSAASGTESARSYMPELTLEDRARLEAVWSTHLGRTLLPFQREGVAFAVRQGGRALIGDEMGLGKTLQGLAAAAAYRDEWPLLVVAPAALRLGWAAEVRRWLPEETDVEVLDSSEAGARLGRVTVCSYDLLARLGGRLAAGGFGVVLADESHYLKTPESQRTRAAAPLLRAARRALLLTGTPALSRPVELFAQLGALRPGVFSSRAEFEGRYCGARPAPWGVDVSGAANLRELHVLLWGLCMVRRLKADVLAQLPAKRRQSVPLPLPAAAVAPLRLRVRALLAAEGRAGAAAWEGDSGPGSESDERDGDVGVRERAALYRETGEAKADAAWAYAGALLDGGAKVLLFAHHARVLDRLEAAARARGVGHVRVDGGVEPAERAARVAAFQREPGLRVALLSMTAAGTGLTLTAAGAVVFAELHWTPGVLLQAGPPKL